jgi:hypothetical protein
MAITYTLLECGLPVSLGQDGAVLARLILDGAATTIAITIPSDHPMKTIKAATGCTVAANGIGAAGVASTTGFTATVPAGTSGHAQDIIIWGSGR